MVTTFHDVIESFESSFADKKEIPESLIKMWLIKSIGDYGVEINPLNYDEDLEEFDSELDRYTIDTLALMIKIKYIEREYNKNVKIASVVGKDISINGTNGLQKYTKDDLEKSKQDLIERLDNLKPTAYS